MKQYAKHGFSKQIIDHILEYVNANDKIAEDIAQTIEMAEDGDITKEQVQEWFGCFDLDEFVSI